MNENETPLTEHQQRYVQDQALVLYKALDRVGPGSEMRIVRTLMEFIKRAGEDRDELREMIASAAERAEDTHLAYLSGGMTVTDGVIDVLYDIIQAWAYDVLSDLPLARWTEAAPEEETEGGPHD